ncbi:MAG: hypothetical protein RQ754_11495 [Desulfuromonadales bacterium]|nr:hypothetical protein [Desulfuromonadales bacterium]
MTEDKNSGKKIQVRVPAEVARIMKQWGGREMKLAAARGTLPMSGPHLVTVLFVLCYGQDDELKSEALKTLRELPPQILTSAISQKDVLPEVLDLIARIRFRDPGIMQPLLTSRNLPLKTLLFLAERASGETLEIIAANEQAMMRAPALKTLIVNNPHADKTLKLRLGWIPDPVVEAASQPQSVVAEQGQVRVDEEITPDETFTEDDDFTDFEDDDLSKYQKLLEMPVSEKIKMAMTGDKEWRTLLLRESNKLVTSAVLKNPRISENEVILVAKNRASSDDMIRIILLNKEWVKHYEIKKALAIHPRTPLQKAMRFMGFLTEKDLKDISRSKQVPQAIATNARRLLAAKSRNR